MTEVSFVQAVSCLSRVRVQELNQLSQQERAACEEIRLRAGQPLHITLAGTERVLHGPPLRAEELQDTVARACGYSVHTHISQLARGYVTLQGGHRLGICGTAAEKGGEILSFRAISSLNLRIARPVEGCAQKVAEQIVGTSGRLRSALILSPPGRGKTTLLRDLSRQLCARGIRVGLADERGELAALYHGVPQLEVGAQADVIDGCPKAEAALMLVRTMAPQVLILDEITAPEDIRAALYASHCGVAVVASAHAFDRKDFHARPLYQQLLEAKIFSLFFQIGHDRQVQLIE